MTELLKARLLVAQADLAELQEKYNRLRNVEDLMPKDGKVNYIKKCNEPNKIYIYDEKGKLVSEYVENEFRGVGASWVFTECNGSSFHLGSSNICDKCGNMFYTHEYPGECPRCKKPKFSQFFTLEVESDKTLTNVEIDLLKCSLESRIGDKGSIDLEKGSYNNPKGVKK